MTTPLSELEALNNTVPTGRKQASKQASKQAKGCRFITPES